MFDLLLIKVQKIVLEFYKWEGGYLGMIGFKYPTPWHRMK